MGDEIKKLEFMRIDNVLTHKRRAQPVKLNDIVNLGLKI